MYCFPGFALFNSIPLKKIFRKESYQSLSPAKIIGTVVLGLSLSEIVIGILFKVQDYEGSAIQLISGLFFLTIILIISVIRYRKNKSGFYKNIFKRINKK